MLLGTLGTLTLGACDKGRDLSPSDGGGLSDGADRPADLGGSGGSSSGGTSGGVGGKSGAGGTAGAGAGGTTSGGGTSGAGGAVVTPVCPSGQHPCAGNCVSNSDPQTCGQACTPCQAPVGGTATCDGSMCGGGCPSGDVLCLGTCIAANAPCSGSCPTGTHACGGLCASNQAVTSCGTSCTPCPVPAGAEQATCGGTSCAFVCATGYHLCGDTCQSDDDVSACGSSCMTCAGDPNGAATCVAGICGLNCSASFHLCGGQCVSAADPATCGTSCTACQAPTGGSATCVTGQCGSSCPTGQTLCNSTCITNGTACSGQCPSGTHDCSGLCAANTSVNSCGSSCTSCPVPTGAAGATCGGTSCAFTCSSGYHLCGSACSRDDDATACSTSCTNCPTDPHGSAVCQSGACGLMCATDYHLCGTTCVSNSAVATCGQTAQTSCTACQAPTGGTVSCDGLSCMSACPGGQILCNGACIASTTACNGTCPTGTHNCNGTCKSNTDVGSCGTQCSPCAAPAANGQATCATNGMCGIMCNNQYRLCAGTTTCVSSTACCAAADCTAGPTGTIGACNANVCSYSCNTPSYKQCGNSCVTAATCCTPCTNGYVCKAGQCPSSCTADTDCTSAHFCRNGVCIGKVTQLAGGSQLNCSLHDDGVIRCWGYNGNGQVGVVGVSGAQPTIVPLPLAATQVVAGQLTACAVLTDGTVWCWGATDGNGSFAPTPYLSLSNVASMDLGPSQSGCVVLKSGSLECWGLNGVGQLGLGTIDSAGTTHFPPATVPGLTGVTQVSNAGYQVCALLSGGTMSCWGGNNNGEVGDGTFVQGTITVMPNPVPSPTTVASISGATQIGTGGNSSYALLGGINAGILMSWGSGNSAGRGNSAGLYLTPGRAGGTLAFDSIAGTHTSCGVSRGIVACWGNNFYGQAGAPISTQTVFDAVGITGLQNVTAVGVGADTACAVTGGGLTVMCWGNDTLGQLGDGNSNAGGPTPVTVVW